MSKKNIRRVSNVPAYNILCSRVQLTLNSFVST